MGFGQPLGSTQGRQAVVQTYKPTLDAKMSLTTNSKSLTGNRVPVLFSRTLPAALLVLTLTACGSASGSDNASSSYPARIAMPAAHAAAFAMRTEVAPSQPADAAWREDGVLAASFGAPGGSPLVSLACEGAPGLTARLRVTRHVAADAGASALFALIGQRHVARLAVTQTSAQWAGDFLALDPALDVFAEVGTIKATVPGGGELKLGPSPLPARLLAACRAGAELPQSLPNLPSNPAVSPEER